jgi:hypothetical protein
MSDTQEKRENNQTLFKAGLTTKHAKECDFGTGIPSFYEAPDMHFVTFHASVLLASSVCFSCCDASREIRRLCKIVFSGFFKLLSGTYA